MCFTIPRTQSKAKRATKDIPCWKKVFKDYLTLKKSYRSAHFSFQYELGHEYGNYKFLKDRKAYLSSFSKREAKGRHQGFHSLIEEPSPVSRFGNIVIRCHIPKGAYYFSNRREGTYFSNRIFIDEERGY